MHEQVEARSSAARAGTGTWPAVTVPAGPRGTVGDGGAARLPPPARREDRVDGRDRRVRRRAGAARRRRATRRAPAYTYTIGFPAHVGFPDVVVFGLTPVAARGLLGLVAELCRGGTEIPLDVELVGLLDNDLRCRFAPVDLDEWGAAVRHRRGLVPRRAVRGRAADLPRPQRLPAVRGRVRPAPALRPAGDRRPSMSRATATLAAAFRAAWRRARQPG